MSDMHILIAVVIIGFWILIDRMVQIYNVLQAMNERFYREFKH
jgi:hypothetical protein